jgi:hypothetical protein
MLCDIDAKNRAADVEEGEIGEDSDAAGAEESEESLTGGKADPQDLVEQKTCFMGRSLMTQADLDALWLKVVSSLESAGYPGKRPRRNPERMKALCSRIFSRWGFNCQCLRGFLRYWPLTTCRFIS